MGYGTDVISHPVKGTQTVASKALDESRTHRIVMSVTEDEEEKTRESMDSYDVDSFLRGYESMMKLQEDENEATLRHLRPLLALLLESARENNKEHLSSATTEEMSNPSYEFKYSDLHKALRSIEDNESFQFVQTDRQWMLTLRTLASNPPSNENAISWAEIVQCYRVCVLGVQTLENVPFPSNVRVRTRQRTVSLLSSFGTSSHQVSSRTQKAASVSQGSCSPQDTDKRNTRNERFHSLFRFGTAFLLGALLNVASTAAFAKPSQEESRMKSSPVWIAPDAAGPYPVVPGPIISPYPDTSQTPEYTHSSSPPVSVGRSVPTPTASPVLKKNTIMSQGIAQHSRPLLGETMMANFRTGSVAAAAILGGTFSVGLFASAVGISASSSTLMAALPFGATMVAASFVVQWLKDFIGSRFSRSRQ